MQSSSHQNTNATTTDNNSKSSWRNKVNRDSSRKRDRSVGELSFQAKANPKKRQSKTNDCNKGNEDDNWRCLFCFSLESYDDDPILICDGCNQCTHLSCYNLHDIPTGT